MRCSIAWLEAKRSRGPATAKRFFHRADHRRAAPGRIRGVAVGELCRKIGISEQSFYRWKKVYGSLQPSEARELKQLRDEVMRVKRLVVH